MRKTSLIIATVLLTILLTLVACESTTATPVPAKTHTIDDLAYIQAQGQPYSDDADPEPEGAEITISWYDTKSELILFEDAPVKVTIEILAAKSEELPHRFTESVYRGEHHIDNYQANIRIPFEQVKVNPEMHNWTGKVNIVAHTPQQGDFSVENILVPLYPQPPIKPPPTPAPLPSPPAKKPPTNIIQDLAYIKAGGGTYTDDADPEPEGVVIRISCWNSKSEMIDFSNITILVDIELYQRGFDMKSGEYLLGRCIYKGKVHIYNALDAIRIPLEDVNANYVQGYRHDTLAKLSIHTPEQGDYSIEGIIAADFGFD